MVKEKEKLKFKCPYCDSIYIDYDEAYDCAQDCVQVDDPIEVGEDAYTCEMCNSKFDSQVYAESCESEHIETEDKFYEQYHETLSKERLAQAASHPNQTKLVYAA